MNAKQRSIPAGEFKARCLRLMDEVEHQRTPIFITKRGKPVAKLVPVDDEVPLLFGLLSGSVIATGDITAPLDEVWNVDA